MHVFMRAYAWTHASYRIVWIIETIMHAILCHCGEKTIKESKGARKQKG